jgi:hypothetical protein
VLRTMKEAWPWRSEAVAVAGRRGARGGGGGRQGEPWRRDEAGGERYARRGLAEVYPSRQNISNLSRGDGENVHGRRGSQVLAPVAEH